MGPAGHPSDGKSNHEEISPLHKKGEGIPVCRFTQPKEMELRGRMKRNSREGNVINNSCTEDRTGSKLRGSSSIINVTVGSQQHIKSEQPLIARSIRIKKRGSQSERQKVLAADK